MKRNKLIYTVFALLISLILVSCSQGTEATQEVTPSPTTIPVPECPECPEILPTATPIVKDIPYQNDWVLSAHNDATSEAFIHWNEDDPQEVPAVCASCHTTQGYQDFLGVDGTEAGAVDNNVPAPAGTIQCIACHNAATADLTSISFPSGISIEKLGAQAVCLHCHQGRTSKAHVDSTLEKYNVVDNLDLVPEAVEDRAMGFINIHYLPSASTFYGSKVQGGYEYEGKVYDSKYDHVAGYDTCTDCHNSHTLELEIEQCASCHQGVSSSQDLEGIRMAGSTQDYDGDGDLSEGIADEIDGLRDLLVQAMQAYSKQVSGSPLVYTQAAYPYFFVDSNNDGRYSSEDTENFTAWTGRLLKAAYNYQFATKDPGAYAHNGKYIIQLLFDSIEDINSILTNPIDISAAERIDKGHFDGSREAFRHWDNPEDNGVVSSSCSKCHTATGLGIFLEEGTSISQASTNGLNCATCHDDLTTFTLTNINEVPFPSGAKLTLGENDESNVCLNCHQGRESKISLDRAIASAGVEPDITSEKLRFINPHYAPSAATLFGAEAMGVYLYEENDYDGKKSHVQGYETCAGCHDAHTLEVKVESCNGCHPVVESAADFGLIRFTKGDFDGDNDEIEGIAGEIETMKEKLYLAIQAYTNSSELPAIVYNVQRYPYWFTDANKNGTADPDESAYSTWTPRLLKAAYNYQWAMKDPAAFTHNGTFMMQVLYDTIADIGGNLSGMIRPPVSLP